MRENGSIKVIADVENALNAVLWGHLGERLGLSRGASGTMINDLT